jgi:NADH:ubiquinone oxidoreductase subunit 3 (subunit A)
MEILLLNSVLLMYLEEYFSLFFYVGFSFALSTLLFLLSFFLAVSSGDPQKLSAYECGFNPFEDARSQFDVRFYIVAILFIIFDLEISFLFPWALILKSIGGFGFWSMLLFLLILTFGFIYEWQKGALEWE